MSTLKYSEKFDLISLLFHVMCHLSEEDLKSIFGRFYELLMPGGFVCFDVIKKFEVGEHGYTKADQEQERNYACYHSLTASGEKVRNAVGNVIIGTDRMFSREEIAHFATGSGLEVVKIQEFEVQNPDPKIGSLKEFAVILKKPLRK